MHLFPVGAILFISVNSDSSFIKYESNAEYIYIYSVLGHFYLDTISFCTKLRTFLRFTVPDKVCQHPNSNLHICLPLHFQ